MKIFVWKGINQLLIIPTIELLLQCVWIEGEERGIEGRHGRDEKCLINLFGMYFEMGGEWFKGIWARVGINLLNFEFFQIA